MISEHGALRRRGKPWALFLVMLTPGGGDKTEPGVAPARLSQAAGQPIGRSLSTDGEWSSLEPPGHDYGRVLLRWRSTDGTFIRVAALRPLRRRVNLRLVREAANLRLGCGRRKSNPSPRQRLKSESKGRQQRRQVRERDGSRTGGASPPGPDKCLGWSGLMVPEGGREGRKCVGADRIGLSSAESPAACQSHPRPGN
jgi:hypothetical protein